MTPDEAKTLKAGERLRYDPQVGSEHIEECVVTGPIDDKRAVEIRFLKDDTMGRIYIDGTGFSHQWYERIK